MRSTAGMTAATLLLLGGCGLNSGATPEERINAAAPLDPQVAQQTTDILNEIGADAGARARFQTEIETRLKVRALTCAKGYSPAFYESLESVRAHLNDLPCFQSFDKATGEWLGKKRLTILLQAPALRARPAQAPEIFATTYQINSVRFAGEAAVALVTSNNSVEIIGLNNGESIFVDKSLTSSPLYPSLSPNGRVFAVGDMNGITLRQSDAGAVLRQMPDYTYLVWISATCAVAARKDGRGADLLDMASDQVIALKGLNGSPTRILPLRGGRGQFVVATYGIVTKYDMHQEEGGVKLTLLNQQPGPQSPWGENVSDSTSSGNHFVQGSSELWVTDLDTLHTEQLSIKPLMAQSVTPMPSPDEVLIRAYSPGGGFRSLIYSVTGKTFSLVDDEQLTGAPGYSAVRTVYIPFLQRAGIVTGPTIRLFRELKHGFLFNQQALASQIEEVQRLAMEQANAQMRASLVALSGPIAGVATGRLPAAARDARIEAVGVYESAGGSHRPGQASVAGPVVINLRRSKSPMVLVLASYEPVAWRIDGDARFLLKAILLASYSPNSTVNGADSVPVIQIGQTYAYDRGTREFTALQAEVMRWTEKPIDTFQGRYTGASFQVGGL